MEPKPVPNLENKEQVRMVLFKIHPVLWTLAECLLETNWHNAEPLEMIAKRVNEIKYGNVSVTLRVHDKKITDVVENSHQRFRFDIDDS